MFSKSFDNFTHAHVAGGRTLWVNTVCLHVCILRLVEEEYWKSVFYLFISSIIY